MQVVVSADHGQTVLGACLVRWQAHLINLQVRNCLSSSEFEEKKNDVDLWLCIISVVFPLLLILFDYAQRWFVERCL